MSTTPAEVEAGQAVYGRFVLSIYDVAVLGISNRLIWKCPTQRLLAHYDRHVTANHLDVGVGSGYFLDHCRFPSPAPRVALVDLNANALAFASRRIARLGPETYRRNVLEPIAIDAGGFDSIGINYLLHCLPGSIESKAVALDHLARLLNAGGVIFGATLLGHGVPRSFLARHLMRTYNLKGIFSNERDDLEGLKRELSRRFGESSVEVVGCAALFSARIPHTAQR